MSKIFEINPTWAEPRWFFTVVPVVPSRAKAGWGKTSEVLLAAYHTGDAVGTTLDLDRSPQVGSA